MALVGGSRVETVQDGENTLAVKTDVVVDTESGLLVERKTVVAEVLTESGNHKAILVGQQTTVRAVPGAGPQYRAIGSRPQTYGSSAYSPAYTPSRTDNSGAMHCMFCLLTVLFPPVLCCWILYCLTKD